MKVLYVSLGVVIVDQISKLLVKGFFLPFLNLNFEGMYLGQMIPIWGDFFRITFVENPGMAFGYDPGNGFKLMISIFSLLASIGLIFYLYVIRNKSLTLRIAIALILGGAVGNLIDRTFYGVIFNYAPIFYGRVVDFFDFNFFDFTLFGRSYDRWPVFNIADAAVTIGVLILLFFYKKNQEIDVKEKDSQLAETPVDNIQPKTDVKPMDENKLKDEQTDNRKEIPD